MNTETAIPSKRPLYKMFNEVPRRYDFMNRLLTWYFDEKWRKKTARICTEKPGRILDLCTGTGDLAIHVAKKVNGESKITGLDFSVPMLEVAQRKALRKSLDKIRFMEGDVAKLPFKDACFDTIGTAFAFRNLTFRNPLSEQYLSEISRVIKKGGRFIIVETSQPENKSFQKIFHYYLKNMVGKIGGVISGHQHAYHYLAFSAINFYNPSEVKELLLSHGFSQVEHERLMYGISAIYVATK
ncbi:ubiquinone/menaquinone biosynthesis methyltransferase [Bacteroidota bacterium]